MAHQIIWTKRADSTLYKQVSYLAKNWPDQVVAEFVDKVYHVTDLLTNFPDMGKVIDADKGIRSVLINPYVRLSYRVENDRVVLIRFTDTRQNPT